MKKHILVLLLISQFFVSTMFLVLLNNIQNPASNSEDLNDDASIMANFYHFSDVKVISDGLNGYWNDRLSTQPAIAFDNSTGTLHVVWADDTQGIWGVDREIWYTSYAASTGWSNAVLLSDGYGGSYWNDGVSEAPKIAVDVNGTIHVVWWDRTVGEWGSDWTILYVNYTSGSGWSNVTAISDMGLNSWNTGDSISPDIAVDRNAVVHVVWSDSTVGPWGGGGSDYEIFYLNYTAGIGWTNATLVSDGYGGSYWNDGSSAYPAIAVDNNGTIHCCWQDTSPGWWGGDLDILYANCTANGTWSNVTAVSDDSSQWNWGSSQTSDIAIDSAGKVYVVWYDATDGPWSSDTEIMISNYSAGTGWSNASAISGIGVNSWNDDESINPAIATDYADNVHVTWQDYTTGSWGGGFGDYEIFYMNYTAGVGWSNATALSGVGANSWNDLDSQRPAIVADNNSIIHMVWEDATQAEWTAGGGENEILYSHTSSSWTNATVISDDIWWNDGFSRRPAITTDPNTGVVHAAWSDTTNGAWGTDPEIMYANYTEIGGWSPTYVISGTGVNAWNTWTSNSPAMAVDTNSVLHMVWEDNTPGPWGPPESRIFYMNYTAGVGWSNATAITGWGVTSWLTGTKQLPDIAIDSNNNLHVTFRNLMIGASWTFDNSDFEIWYINHTTSSGWSNATLLSDNGNWWNDADSDKPAIGVDASGIVHVVWEDHTNGPWTTGGTDLEEIFYVNYTAGIGWSNVTVISDNLTGNYWNDDSSLDPDIAVESAGIVHVVWGDTTTQPQWGSDAIILYRSYQAGIGWSNVTSPSDEGINFWNNLASHRPSVAVDSTGAVHIAWSDSTPLWSGTDTDIFYTTYVVGKGWLNASIISDDATDWNNDSSTFPAIAVDNTRTVHAVWEDLTDDIWGTDIEVMVTSFLPPPAPPDLQPLSNDDYTVYLNWSYELNATQYYVYRDTSEISSTSGLTPIATTALNSTQETVPPGTWYYVIVAGNNIGNSSISNCENITLQSPTATSTGSASHPHGSSATTNWTITDEGAGGYYRVLRNDSPYAGWNTWTSGSPVVVPVLTNVTAAWNYTIQYNDSTGLWGIPDMVIITIYDNTDPWINEPLNSSHLYGSVVSFTWQPRDNVAGGYYRIISNQTGASVGWTSWNNLTDIVVNVNTTQLTIWNYTIEFNDSVGLVGKPNTVLRTIYDNILPTSNTPSDASHEQGAIATIPWVLTDNVLGGYYRVLKNQSVHFNWTQWTSGSNLAVPINSSVVGVWNYTIQYNDSVGNGGLPHTVIITITTPTPEDEPIPGFDLIITLIPIPLLVIITILRKHRKKIEI